MSNNKKSVGHSVKVIMGGSANANEQPMVGGNHYRKRDGEQHWDRAIRLGWDIFQYQITKYVERWKDKDGLKDLKKAQHFLQKYIEEIEAGNIPQPPGAAVDDLFGVPANDPAVKPPDFEGGVLLGVGGPYPRHGPFGALSCDTGDHEWYTPDVMDPGYVVCRHCKATKGDQY